MIFKCNLRHIMLITKSEVSVNTMSHKYNLKHIMCFTEVKTCLTLVNQFLHQSTVKVVVVTAKRLQNLALENHKLIFQR